MNPKLVQQHSRGHQVGVGIARFFARQFTHTHTHLAADVDIYEGWRTIGVEERLITEHFAKCVVLL